MKKIVIPAILAATMLIGMSFAFMPVEKASAIHTTLGGAVNKVLARNAAAGTVLVGALDGKLRFGDICVSAGGVFVNVTTKTGTGAPSAVDETASVCTAYTGQALTTDTSAATNATATVQVTPT